jgi:hypothetical protein
MSFGSSQHQPRSQRAEPCYSEKKLTEKETDMDKKIDTNPNSVPTRSSVSMQVAKQ